MSFADMVRRQVAQERRSRFERSDQLSLGELIAQLEKQDPGHSIQFDFCRAIPTTLASWRGAYDELALGFDMDGKDPSVGELLEHLRTAVGRTYTGWKGGDFVMSLETPVWVANPGDGCNTAIIGVEGIDYQVVIQTAYMGF
ncbi:MAG: hypothetical protein KC442_11690 [Thermomicrobiales bacterium]|nr:hypothetical protein [Thermomicrobiales bacterium]